MKFAFQLSENLVPEWRDQYLDYKNGKKLLKKIGKNASKPSLLTESSGGAFQSLMTFSAGAKERAMSIVRPMPARVTNLSPGLGTASTVAVGSDLENGIGNKAGDNLGNTVRDNFANNLSGFSLPPPATSPSASEVPGNKALPAGKITLTKPSYGSTNQSSLPIKRLPKQQPQQPGQQTNNDQSTISEHSPLLEPKKYKPFPAQQTYPEDPTHSGSKRNFRLKSIVGKFSSTDPFNQSPNVSANSQNGSGNPDSPKFDAMYTADEQEFMDWLDGEFIKIEGFFRKKEDDSVERYLILQDQLFNLREQKYTQKAIQEKRAAAFKAITNKNNGSEITKTDAAVAATKSMASDIKSKLNRKFDLPSLPAPLQQKLFGKPDDEYEEELKYSQEEQQQKDSSSAVSTAGALTGPSNAGSFSDASSIVSVPNAMPSSSRLAAAAGGPYPRYQTFDTQKDKPALVKTVNKNDISKPNEPTNFSKGHNKDYSRRIRDQRISYGVARRQLKLAVVELYRELEMLKSYRSLNQTAFRKMIKKFDKVTGHNAQPLYMTKVKKSYFSQSELLDDLIRKTEDMFAFYFESGSHKHAVEKLRANTVHEQHYVEMFLTGISLGLTVPIAIRATYKGISDMNAGDPDALFLFQIWGGFFLIILFLCLFAINCIVWTIYKVNYPFVFEFNPLSHLDAKQVGTVPSLLLFLLSLLAWLCFENFWPDRLPQIYFPVIYLVLVLVILFWPCRGFYQNARKWLSIAFWRVLFSGLYPVEFRDLIMGDISCSLTYSISNTAFFFCLYATRWSGLLSGSASGSSCGSSHSRWMGFLSTLPGIWRFLQCGRRYMDSGDLFPHVANMGKYSVQIASNAFLSAYRINLSSTSFRTLFIFFASMNTIYSGFWDLFMDWSVMQFNSKNFLLRDELAFKSKTPYYVAMVLDPLLRCNWIFYAIYATQVQQSAKVSFFVSLAELLRRFLWVFFRVENEHCSNVLRFRASRDITLPYTIVRRNQSVKGDNSETSTIVTTTTTTADEGDTKKPAKPLDEEARIGIEQTETGADGSTETERSSVSRNDGVQPSKTKHKMPKPESFSARLYRFVAPALEAIGYTLQTAHVRDFERRKDKHKAPLDRSSIDSDDEDEEDEEEEFYDDMSQASRHSGRSR